MRSVVSPENMFKSKGDIESHFKISSADGLMLHSQCLFSVKKYTTISPTPILAAKTAAWDHHHSSPASAEEVKYLSLYNYPYIILHF